MSLLISCRGLLDRRDALSNLFTKMTHDSAFRRFRVRSPLISERPAASASKTANYDGIYEPLRRTAPGEISNLDIYLARPRAVCFVAKRLSTRAASHRRERSPLESLLGPVSVAFRRGRIPRSFRVTRGRGGDQRPSYVDVSYAPLLDQPPPHGRLLKPLACQRANVSQRRRRRLRVSSSARS